MLMDDPDHRVRLAAFQRLRMLGQLHGGPVPWAALNDGFNADGAYYRFASAAEGIFRPRGMTGVLSLKTVVPKPRGRVWYHDQVAPEFSAPGEVFWYAFRGADPGQYQNRYLKDAMERQLPLVYLAGVAPGLYEAVFPAFVVEWDAVRLSCGLSFSAAESSLGMLSAPAAPERRYALRVVQQRLHQSAFRERVLDAYGRRCALTGLPATRLIDAAHIIADSDEVMGQPDIRNGIAMSKLHHAAFDAGLIGIDQDLRIHISNHLLEMFDGPMLEQGLKALDGRIIREPQDPRAKPDRERLATRFEQFRLGV